MPALLAVRLDLAHLRHARLLSRHADLLRRRRSF
jgi:hypothetical protein